MADRLGEMRTEIWVVLVIAVVAAGFYFFGGDATGPAATDTTQETNLSDEFFTYASTGEDAASKNVRGATDFAEVSLTSSGATPSRVNTEIGGPVRWENRLDFTVRLSFENVPEDLMIEPGEREAMRFRSISYYDVFNDRTGEKVAQGSIVVG